MRLRQFYFLLSSLTFQKEKLAIMLYLLPSLKCYCTWSFSISMTPSWPLRPVWSRLYNLEIQLHHNNSIIPFPAMRTAIKMDLNSKHLNTHNYIADLSGCKQFNKTEVNVAVWYETDLSASISEPLSKQKRALGYHSFE